MVAFALDTDTAGSGRVSASLNGIVGFKSTKETVSARDVVPACRSSNTVSAFTSCVADARSVWQILDAHDAGCVYAKPLNTLPLNVMDYRGVADGYFTFTVPPPEALGFCPIPAEDYTPFVKASDLLYTGALVNDRSACIVPDFINVNPENLHPTTRQIFSAVLFRNTKPWDVFVDRIAQVKCTRKAQQLFENINVMILPGVPFHPTIADMDHGPIVLNARIGESTHFANVPDLCGGNINAAFYESEHGTMPFGIGLIGGLGMDGRVADISEHLEAHLTTMN
ncbi:hypothetical protein E8E11_009211 [Didymella keratinophila]|nr:hypothetical protein E8E11_009211 [Didymella keratinophila]